MRRRSQAHVCIQQPGGMRVEQIWPNQEGRREGQGAEDEGLGAIADPLKACYIY